MKEPVTKFAVTAVEEKAALTWAEIAGLVDIRADGSWNSTDLAKRILRRQRGGLGDQSTGAEWSRPETRFN